MYNKVITLSNELQEVGEEIFSLTRKLTPGELTDEEVFALADLLIAEVEINKAIEELDGQKEDDLDQGYLKDVYDMLLRQEKTLKGALHLFKRRAEILRVVN